MIVCRQRRTEIGSTVCGGAVLVAGPAPGNEAALMTGELLPPSIELLNITRGDGEWTVEDLLTAPNAALIDVVSTSKVSALLCVVS